MPERLTWGEMDPDERVDVDEEQVYELTRELRQIENVNGANAGKLEDLLDQAEANFELEPEGWTALLDELNSALSQPNNDDEDIRQLLDHYARKADRELKGSK